MRAKEGKIMKRYLFFGAQCPVCNRLPEAIEKVVGSKLEALAWTTLKLGSYWIRHIRKGGYAPPKFDSNSESV
jgi:hypothetical protein